MAEANAHDRTLRVKIVYYGPPLGGKTTNLQVLQQHAKPERRGEMISVNTLQDRTLLFDMLPLNVGGRGGMDVRLQLLAVPGQVRYAATRRVVLKGADGVVFVANSATDRWQENLVSLEELKNALIAQQIDPARIPLVLQYNKRDLPDVTATELLDRALNEREANAAVPSIATGGVGVLETFSAIVERTMQDLQLRFPRSNLTSGVPLAEWTRQLMEGMFGRLSLDAKSSAGGGAGLRLVTSPEIDSDGPAHAETSSPSPTTKRRTIKVPAGETSEEAGSGLSEGQATVSLADSYAEACSELSIALAEAQEDAQRSLGRLEEMQHAVKVSRALSPGDPETIVRSCLSCLGEAAGAAHASFGLAEMGTLRGIPLPPLPGDPLLVSLAGSQFVHRFDFVKDPVLCDATESPELRELLDADRTGFAALAVVPVRTGYRFLGLALLYFLEGDSVPTPDTLERLSNLAAVFALALAPSQVAVPDNIARLPQTSRWPSERPAVAYPS